MALTTISPALQDTQAQYTGFKNRIINGAMMIDQRNAGASTTPTVTNTYNLDRWKSYLSQASKFSVRSSSTAPSGFVNSLLVTSTSAYLVGSTEYFLISQLIEGLNVADLGWGAAEASAVTLSFQVRSSLTGTFGGAIGNAAGDRSYPFSYSIPVANTWTTISIAIPGDTTGTWLKTNGAGIAVYFSLGAGSSVSSTAGSWASSFYVSATGATSVVGTNGATFYITGVQLEKGSTATSFDYRPYGTELALCQRYYRKTDTSALYGEGSVYGYGSAGTSIGQAVPYPVPMRVAATAAYGGTWALNNMGSTQYVVGNTSGYFPYISSAGGASSQYSNYSGYITFTAEL